MGIVKKIFNRVNYYILFNRINMRTKFLVIFLLLAGTILTGASCFTKSATTTGPMGLYRSVDEGEKWIQVAALPTSQGVKSIEGIKVYRIFEDPSDANAYYVGTRGQGLYYTLNNGDSWQSVPFMANKFIYALVVDPKDKCTIYVSDGANIYKTIDCTRTWETVFTEQRTKDGLRALDMDVSSGKVIYGAELNGDIIASRDEGKSWAVIKRFNVQLYDLVVDRQTPNRFYVATYQSGLYRTDDGGANWIDLREGLKKYNDSKKVYRIVLNPSKKDSLFWACKYGILKSDDAGNTWTDLKLLTPPGQVSIFAFAVHPTNDKKLYYTATILGEKNVPVRSTYYTSDDGGTTWVTKKLPTNTIPMIMKVKAIKEGTLMLLGFALLN